MLGVEVSPSCCGAESSVGKWEVFADLRKSWFLVWLDGDGL